MSSSNNCVSSSATLYIYVGISTTHFVTYRERERGVKVHKAQVQRPSRKPRCNDTTPEGSSKAAESEGGGRSKWFFVDKSDKLATPKIAFLSPGDWMELKNGPSSRTIG